MTFMNTKQDNTADIGIAHRTGPLHKWLADEIRSKVIRGDITPDQPLETEAELAQRYQVSRGTVRQAMTTLVNEGLIDRQAGRRSFIRETGRPPSLQKFPTIQIQCGRQLSKNQADTGLSRLADQAPADKFCHFPCIRGVI